MEKYAWKAEIIDGKRDEYVRRHDEIWQEMKDTLKRAGIKIIPYGFAATNCSDITNANTARNSPRRRKPKAPSSKNGTNI